MKQMVIKLLGEQAPFIRGRKDLVYLRCGDQQLTLPDKVVFLHLCCLVLAQRRGHGPLEQVPLDVPVLCDDVHSSVMGDGYLNIVAVPVGGAQFVRITGMQRSLILEGVAAAGSMI